MTLEEVPGLTFDRFASLLRRQRQTYQTLNPAPLPHVRRTADSH